jgi:hypothetical protein
MGTVDGITTEELKPYLVGTVITVAVLLVLNTLLNRI